MSSIDHLLNTVHCMDCLEFMKKLPDKCIDLVLTDPPYGINMSKGTHLKCDEKSISSKRKMIVGDWDSSKPSKDYFQEIFRVSKNQVIWGANYFSEHLAGSRGWIFWDKKIDERSGSNFADGEIAYTSFDRNVAKYSFATIGFDGLNNPQKEDKIHPTQKPLPLFRWILENYSEKGMTILDPFAGSGTTGVACKELGRDYILIEKEPKYVDVINKRLANTTVSLFHS